MSARTSVARAASDGFRDVIGHFATGVTVITTAAEGRYGKTASAISSLSLERECCSRA